MKQCPSCGGDCGYYKQGFCSYGSLGRAGQTAGYITFTRDEVKKHEAHCEELRDKLYEAQRGFKSLESYRPDLGLICKQAFEARHGFTVCADMDIQTEVAWENWKIAWSTALQARQINVIGPGK